jgi:hypothetical protein
MTDAERYERLARLDAIASGSSSSDTTDEARIARIERVERRSLEERIERTEKVARDLKKRGIHRGAELAADSAAALKDQLEDLRRKRVGLGPLPASARSARSRREIRAGGDCVLTDPAAARR